MSTQLIVLPDPELTEREHVEAMLSEMATVVQHHLPHLSRSNPWHPAGVEILRQADRMLGRRRVRLASNA